MRESSYSPGGLAAVVTGSVVLVTDGAVPAATLNAVWETAGAGGDADAVAVALISGEPAAGSLDALPPFALAAVEGDLLRVLARPGVAVAVGDVRGPHQLVARGDVHPWVSELVPVPEVLWLGPVHDTPEVLPVGSGVVRAAWVAWSPAAELAAVVPGAADHLVVPVQAGPAAVADEPASPESFDVLIGAAPAVHGAVVETPFSGFAAEFLAEATVPAGSPRGQHAATGPALPGPWTPARLRFSDGLVVEVSGPLRIGRSPSGDLVGGPRPVAVDNPSREMSRNHVEVLPEGDVVFVVDLGSANGTVVSLPGRAAVRLEPRTPFLLEPGAVLALASDVHAVLETD